MKSKKFAKIGLQAIRGGFRSDFCFTSQFFFIKYIYGAKAGKNMTTL
jgi:hypothetical protein